MKLYSVRFLLALAGLALLARTAPAGPLATDPAAIAGWTGTASFLGTNGVTTLMADVDYAVYAPGQFSLSNALGDPLDPSSGTQYVYAYEIFNDVGGNTFSRNLSIAILGDIPGIVQNLSDDATTPEGGVVPNLIQFVPENPPFTNVKWTFNDPVIAVGQHSDILLFTSPFGPHFLTAGMQGGSATVATAPLPSPTPEPTTILLGCLGAGALLASRLVRRQRRPFKSS